MSARRHCCCALSSQLDWCCCLSWEDCSNSVALCLVTHRVAQFDRSDERQLSKCFRQAFLSVSTRCLWAPSPSTETRSRSGDLFGWPFASTECADCPLWPISFSARAIACRGVWVRSNEKKKKFNLIRKSNHTKKKEQKWRKENQLESLPVPFRQDLARHRQSHIHHCLTSGRADTWLSLNWSRSRCRPQSIDEPSYSILPSWVSIESKAFFLIYRIWLTYDFNWMISKKNC